MPTTDVVRHPLLPYLQYFWYLGWNWNFRLAAFILRHEWIGERKYGIATTGTDDLTRSVPAEKRLQASVYQPLNYYIAEWLFDQLNPEDCQSGFLDLGCGRGRLMVMAAHKGFRHITGIDLSPQLCHEAIGILDDIQDDFPETLFTVECTDASEWPVEDDIGVIMLFNPFGPIVMQQVIRQVRESLHRRPRRLTVLYANPQCRQQWLDAGFIQTAYHRRMTYLEGSVLIWEPDSAK